MNLKYLREFVVLADVGDFSSAAMNLSISQSTLSKHIMRLEMELGLPLFYRTTRKMNLTEYGTGILPYIRRILEVETEYLAILSKEKKN